jgi:hypothetical protein
MPCAAAQSPRPARRPSKADAPRSSARRTASHFLRHRRTRPARGPLQQKEHSPRLPPRASASSVIPVSPSGSLLTSCSRQISPGTA